MKTPGLCFDVPPTGQDRTEPAETRSIGVGDTQLFFIVAPWLYCRLWFLLTEEPHHFNDHIRDLWL